MMTNPAPTMKTTQKAPSTTAARTNKPRILVIGGTGMLGRPVVHRLLTDGQCSVRVLSRQPPRKDAGSVAANDDDDDDDDDNNHHHPDLEYITGNVLDESSLRKAMTDCMGVHINLSGGSLEREGAQCVANVAPTIPTMRRITLISGISTNAETAQEYPTIAGPKWEAEQVIQRACAATPRRDTSSSGRLSYTIFRCTMFLETLPNWKYLIGTHTAKWHWIGADDYARMVSQTYTICTTTTTTTTLAASAAASGKENEDQDLTHNKVFYVKGPGPPRTLPEALYDVYLPLCDPHKSIPIYSQWWAKLWALILADSSMAKGMAKQEWLAQISEGDVSATQILGAPTIVMEDWCHKYNAARKEESATSNH